MSTIQGVSFEKDEFGHERFVRIDLEQHAQAIYPFLVSLGMNTHPDGWDGWDEALTSEEFFEEAKKMLKRKFNEHDKVLSNC